ncbi:hypothetical protein FXF51_05785 [Nonomuraea sp. PA05]|uniref:DUF7694 domain-containing protein n=1 Tax=Nonomuraea sp. PA05 TaxID=2604466 RepID=UPI0011D88136|nr:hypothetical protein [Nonomuraea sp. PA05]TYB69671.1 hypothetical protein FXF51_05785 [Nonomuraea sp. PA05]
MLHLVQLDCDPTHLFRALKQAGMRPTPPEPFGPCGVVLLLRDLSGTPAGKVIVTQGPLDDTEWLHASISWRDRMPTYDELTVVKAGVFGPEREAYQVFPPQDRHVNIHNFALHLWGRADGVRVLPDFGQWGTI